MPKQNPSHEWLLYVRAPERGFVTQREEMLNQ